MTFTKPSINVSDSIHFKSIDTGGNSAGNGGDGTFKGDVVNEPVLSFNPTNAATGASFTVNTGDHVEQKAHWDVSANATSTVHASTTATQTNHLTADMYQEVMAGIGGDGGSGNAAMGGNVDISFDSTI
jgi:hypothetical protein